MTTTDVIVFGGSVGWASSMLAFIESIAWLRHPLLFIIVVLYTVLKVSDVLIGDRTLEQIRNSRKKSSKENEEEKKVGSQNIDVCDGDLFMDCEPIEDEPEENSQNNNNSKDFSTDTNMDENNPENIKNSQNETEKPEILRKTSRDAEAQTRSRESRDSFRCRGCGVERNRRRFEEEIDDQEFDRDHIGQRSMSDTFKKKKAATIDSPQLVSVHHYIGKLVQVSASNGVMVGDNNCMHIQSSHSEACLSPDGAGGVCFQCQRQRMTDDQKSEMATQADYVQTDGGEYHEHGPEYHKHDVNQSDDEDSQSEEEMMSTGSPPASPLSPPISDDGEMSFDASVPNEGGTSCEVTISHLQANMQDGDLQTDHGEAEDSCEFCPNCLQNSQQRRLSPPSLLAQGGDMKQLFVEAKLKIYKAAKENQAAKELREQQGRSSRRSRQPGRFQRAHGGNGGSNSPPVKSKMNVRESVRKILARRRQSRDRQSSERRASFSEPSHTFYD